MPLILGTNSIKDTGYDVDNSLRFDDGGSEYLQRTPSSTGNRKTWTFSTWIKRSGIGLSAPMNVFGGEDGASRYTDIMIGTPSGADDTFWFKQDTGTVAELRSTLKLRDPSAWYHLVFVYDSTNGTADDRMKMYVNGVQLTSFVTRTNVGSNVDSYVNTSGDNNYVGVYDGSSKWLDGYLCETTLIDGTALTPTSFGEFDSDSPTIWKPKDVSGLTFGTNGFYLEFKQSGTSQNSSGLGADTSGNNQHFAVSNLTAVDQSIDTCTNNACTLNPLYRYTNNMTYSEGNLKVVGGGNSWQGANSTFYINKGKWFFEVKFASATDVGNFYIGWTTAGDYNISEPYDNGIHYYNSDGGEIYANSSALTTADYGTFANGNIMGMALDYDNSLLTVYKNGSAFVTDYDFSSATTTAKSGNLVTPTVAHYGSGTVEWNFSSPSFAISSGNTDANGYGNFEYSVPSGYYSLNTKNLAEFG